ncbi:MAG: hypothetical protein AB7G48_10980 [Nitrospiraceae bacterium]
MMKRRAWIILAVVLIGSLAGCGGWRSSYLNDQTGKAGKGTIEQDLGRPTHKIPESHGMSQWIYQDCPVYQACYVWVLIFDRNDILQNWERAPAQS